MNLYVCSYLAYRGKPQRYKRVHIKHESPDAAWRKFLWKHLQADGACVYAAKRAFMAGYKYGRNITYE